MSALSEIFQKAILKHLELAKATKFLAEQGPPPMPVQTPEQMPVAGASPETPAPQAPPAEEASSVDSILDKLNNIRGGLSFKDPVVYGKLTSLWNGLDNGTKAMLNQRLEEIDVIVKRPIQPQMPEQPPVAPTTPPPAQQTPAAPPTTPTPPVQ